MLQSWECSEEKSLAFLTSGSTGQPKVCAHEWRLLAQEVRALAELFADRRRVVGTVPRYHIYGFLWTILLPRYLEVPFLEARDMMPGQLIRSLRVGDILVSFPLRWDQFSKAGVGFPGGVEGVTSTGPCPPEVIYALRELSLERMVEVYGSSETGGIGWRDEPDDAYRLLPYWSLTGDGRLVREEPGGHRSTPVVGPDLLFGQPDGFVLAGRRDNAVQVGGVNVFPRKVAETIRSHPYVADCEVRLMRPEEGQRLKAFLVLSEESPCLSESRRELGHWLREELSAAERPASLTFGAAMPRDEQGKVADWS